LKNSRNLKNRLKALKNNKTQHKPTPPKEEHRMVPADWEQISDLLFKFDENIPISELFSDISPEYLFEPQLFQSEGRKLLFYDTETTGLGGAGAIVFLAGTAELLPASIRFIQYFAADLPGELDLLEEFQKHDQADTLWVSYNGKSFDAPFLRSKAAMNGIHLTMQHQLDLLHPVRRLWKSIIGSCSLGDIEQRILHLKRPIDIPGELVPAKYFEYLRSNEWEVLQEVIAHHRQDILNMMLLFAKIESLRLNWKQDEVDLYGFARFLEKQDHLLFSEVLEFSAHQGRVESALALGYFWEKEDRYQDALELYSGFTDQSGRIEHRLRQRVLILLEHRFRNYQEALAYIATMKKIDLWPEAQLDYEKREVRLQKKLSLIS
jgi:uncharacterized protein YprB with RNaseH-like and TPR domain